MSKQSLKRWMATAGLTLAGMFSAISVAQAAVVVSFDPAYGSAIPNLGFKGTALVDVPENCSGQGTGYRTAEDLAAESCYIQVLSAHIEFYNTSLGSESVFASFDLLGPYPVNESYFLQLESAYFLNDELAGIGTTASDIFSINLVDEQPESGNSVNFNGFMVLFFESGYQPPEEGLVAGRGATNATIPGVGGARLATCTQLDTESGFCSRTTTSNLATTTFTNVSDVPEPGSLGLVGAALTGLALAHRRRAARYAAA
jgi:PEP-CTERM motif